MAEPVWDPGNELAGIISTAVLSRAGLRCGSIGLGYCEIKHTMRSGIGSWSAGLGLICDAATNRPSMHSLREPCLRIQITNQTDTSVMSSDRRNLTPEKLLHNQGHSANVK